MRYFEVNQPLSLSKQFKIALGEKAIHSVHSFSILLFVKVGLSADPWIEWSETFSSLVQFFILQRYLLPENHLSSRSSRIRSRDKV